MGKPVYGIFCPVGADTSDDDGVDDEEVEVGATAGVVVAEDFSACVDVVEVLVGREASGWAGLHGTELAGVVALAGVVVDAAVVVDVTGSHDSADWAAVVGESAGCARVAVTGVVTRNNAVTETASALLVFRLRVKCGADFKVIVPFIYTPVGAALIAPPELSN
ncbi:hypothetical protein ACFVX3_31245 [Rhodococcus erythropolis]